MVERNLAKVEVAGPSPVFRSRSEETADKVVSFAFADKQKKMTHTLSNQEEERNWYAAKVFFNRAEIISSELRKSGYQVYTQKVIPSLIFIRCFKREIQQVRDSFFQRLSVYHDCGEYNPKPIPESQMEMFILLTSKAPESVMCLGDDREEYHQGDRVRVIEGPFKGVEGHIKRIKKDRKLIVSIPGVTAIALAYIPPQFLEKVEKDD